MRILDTAESFREVGTRVIKKVPALRGRTVVNLFYENSTRTRISFELAAKRLSADVINFSTSGSSVSKGESLKDTALTLQAMGADAIVIRHSSSGSPLDAHEVGEGQRAERGRRNARASDPGPAGPLHDARAAGAARGAAGGDRRRRPALARGALALVRLGEDGRRGHPGGPAHADPARGAGLGRPGLATTSTRSCRSSTSATCSGSSGSGSASSSSRASASTRGCSGSRRARVSMLPEGTLCDASRGR